MNNFARKSALALIIAVSTAHAALAQSDDFLQSQFAYSLIVTTHKVNHYLNYQGSGLHGIIQANVILDKKAYQKLWYYRGKPLGMRRRFKLAVDPDSLGAIVLRDIDGGADGVTTAANIALRLATEARVKGQTIAAVFVPDEYYGDVMNEFTRYNFGTKPSTEEGQQLSIMLKCASGAREDQMFYQRK